MYYELYIDVFFLENLMMDSLILLAVNNILKCGRPFGRLILCGGLGSLLTCAVIVMPLPAPVKLIFFHAVINSVMILAGLKINSLSQFVKAVLLLYAVSAALGGIMILFRPYMRYISFFYAAAAASYYLFMQLWRLMVSVTGRADRIVRVTLYTGKGEKTVNALWDTGNELRDFASDDPVNIIDAGFLHEITQNPETESGFHIIPYRCVGGNRVMTVFRIDKMCVHMKEERWIHRPLLGVGTDSLSGNKEYEMILNPGIFSK